MEKEEEKEIEKEEEEEEEEEEGEKVEEKLEVEEEKKNEKTEEIEEKEEENNNEMEIENDSGESESESDVDDDTTTLFKLLLHQYRKKEKKKVIKKKKNKFIPCMKSFMKCDIPERHDLYNKNKKISVHLKFIANNILSGKLHELPKIGKSDRNVLNEFVKGNLKQHEENMLIVEDVRLGILFKQAFEILLKMAK